jgi:DNA-directed RNA polymerase subunit RPC12/RpoP
MSDTDGWKHSKNYDTVYCAHCGNAVDVTEKEEACPGGLCPKCGSSWTGAQKRSTMVMVTMPVAITGGAG